VFFEAVSSGMGSKKHVVYWNTTNPMWVTRASYE
jgi:hypothetical protein